VKAFQVVGHVEIQERDSPPESDCADQITIIRSALCDVECGFERFSESETYICESLSRRERVPPIS